jgi:ClpP class serine protease/DNA-binding transcriptional MerR regulator
MELNDKIIDAGKNALIEDFAKGGLFSREFYEQGIESFFYGTFEDDIEEDNHIEIVGNSAIIGVRGPIGTYDTWINKYLGVQSFESLGKDLELIEGMEQIDRVIFKIDSPGSNFDGVKDFCNQIMGSDKETIAWIQHTGTSGAYWLGCACNRIVTNETAIVGSIGVITRMYKNSSYSYEFVSKQSPHKKLDPGKKEDQQLLVDRLSKAAEFFIDFVAERRNVSAEFVEKNFGKGGVLYADEALKIGMIDEVLSNDDFVKKYIKREDEKEMKRDNSVEMKELEKKVADLETELGEKEKGIEELVGSAKENERKRVMDLIRVFFAEKADFIQKVMDTGMNAEQCQAMIDIMKTQDEEKEEEKDAREEEEDDEKTGDSAKLDALKGLLKTGADVKTLPEKENSGKDFMTLVNECQQENPGMRQSEAISRISKLYPEIYNKFRGFDQVK